MLQRWIVRLWQSYSTVGLLTGTLFFAASLTPSLLPRAYLMQGALSGVSLAAGYGVGVFALWLWTYLELPQPWARTARTAKLVAVVVCAATAIAFLWRASEWQNSIRQLMQLEPVGSAHQAEVGLIAVLAFVVLVSLARLFQWIYHYSSRKMRRFIPRRVFNVIGFAVAAVLFATIINGVFFRFALHVADASYKKFDALIEDGNQQPTDLSKTAAGPPCSTGMNLDAPDASLSRRDPPDRIWKRF